MVESMQPLVRKWEDSIEAQSGVMADIRVDEDLRGFTADVIARACFGSSYAKGREIFSKLRKLQTAISKQSFLFGVPGYGYVRACLNHEFQINHLPVNLHIDVISSLSFLPSFHHIP